MENNDLILFTKLLEDGSYATAHEALECRWKELKSTDMNESNLVKGYINAATSFELHVRGKTPQSKKVWATFLKYKNNMYSIKSGKKEEYQKLESVIIKIFNRDFK